ncbi:transcriptional regulator [Variovorax sp. WS11]|uniref:MarR family winged helix-turn-helix transcriptional regulator n=1 Tax=Variovorax sp. WS11 TaxID=1105204 RepID=UPI000D0CCD60|nr:MarR family transcriptional regulator [Variovorax sp. WS11]NDZ18579.1 MarR family transcriptional regulator [Variovorax sp. WS11]PSL85209.1 transcriptional regulator [Variovorax sp. WS11]
MPVVDAPTGVEDCSCFAIMRAARQAARLYDAHLKPTGLRISQFLILALLEEVKSAPMNTLAERLDTERTAMGKMASVLERDGLVQIGPAPTDGRMRLVELTQAGERRLRQAFPLWLQAQSRMDALNGTQRVIALRMELAGLDMRNTSA